MDTRRGAATLAALCRRGAAAYGVAYLLSGRQFSLQKCDFVFCGKGEKSPVASKYCGKPLRGCVGSRSAAGAAAPRLVGARIQCILKKVDFPTWHQPGEAGLVMIRMS